MPRIWPLVIALAWSTCASAAPSIVSPCLECHGTQQRRGEVPVIAGQHRDYLRNQLRRFRERHRDSFPMSAFAGGMDDATVDAIASSLAARSWPVVPAKVSTAAVRRGREAATRRDCGSCHGALFLGVGDVPRLAGQHPGYLARQIEGFGRADRYHPPSGTGSPMRTISRAQAGELAAFLHSVGEQAGRVP